MPSPSRRWWLLPSLLWAATPCACKPESAGPEEGPPSVGVKLLTLAPSRIRDTSEYIATLKSRRSIQLTPQVDGQLTRIFVKSGDIVQAGAALMQIDPARQQASVTSAQANRSSQLATLNFAKQSLERAQRLYEGGAVSKQELDQARATFDSSQAAVDSLGAQIRQSEVQLDYYRIAAPVRGVVGDIPVRVGDHVTPGTRLTTLDENGLLEAYISIPVERARHLQPNMEVQLVDAEGQTLSDGKISFVSPQVNEDTQSVLLKTVVQNSGGLLRASQFVRARLVWSTHDGVLIPALSVLRLNGQTFVYVAQKDAGKDGEKSPEKSNGNPNANPNGKLIAHQRPVTLGELVDGAYVATSGVSVGDRLVTAGIQKLSDGAAVVEQVEEHARLDADGGADTASAATGESRKQL